MTKFIVLLGTFALTLPASGVGQAPAVRTACAADIAKFCSDAQDAPSRIQCMNAHRTALSETCREARQAVRRAQEAAGEGQNSAPNANSSPATTPVSATQVPAAAPATSASGLDTVAARIANRSFPSVFAPWAVGPDRTGEASAGNGSLLANIARHDLYWNLWDSLGLKTANGTPYVILSPQFTAESVQAALRNRAALLAANPNLVILANVQYANAHADWLPPDSPYWFGPPRNNEYHNRHLDFTNPAFQDKVAALCAALVRTEVFDGCFLDSWDDRWNNRQRVAQETVARVPLIRKIRAAAGDKAIIVGNVTGSLPLSTAAYLDGIYMEGLGSFFLPDWHTAASNLLWAQSHLRKPAITALEAWYPCPTSDCRTGDPAPIQQAGRADLARMRNYTTLSLVFSNGYVVYADLNDLPTPDHLHDWYPFWGKSLGRPVGALATLDRPDLSGAYTRLYQNGEVVFNPPSNHKVIVSFPEPRRSAANNVTSRSFEVPPGDGDLFLKIRSAPK